MRNYECTCRRKGTHYVRARHAFDAMKQAAEYWNTDAGHITVELVDVAPAHHRSD